MTSRHKASACAALALACGGLALFLKSGPAPPTGENAPAGTEDGSPESSGEVGPGLPEEAAAGADPKSADRDTPASEHPADCPHCAAGAPHPVTVRRAERVIRDERFDDWTEKDTRLELELPDGRRGVGVIERSVTDADGGWVMIEGRMREPAEGRFLFRKQPEGTPSERYVGAIRFPEADDGYVLSENDEGKPVLRRRHADEVSCVGFPEAAAPIPEADEDEIAGEAEELVPDEHPTDRPIPDYQNGVRPLESLPGATAVIYLDFDGEPGPHEGWGDFDAAPSGSSNAEIFEIWARVAEDFAPYDINVTTDLRVYQDAPETSRQRCIITPTNDAAPGAGGVAFLGSWNWAGDTPCWSFYTAGKGSAEATSHEIGHTLGLSHDGQDPDTGYYGGHGSGEVGWAPIMGVGYYQNLTQWSRGEYADADQTQDDLAIMAGFNAVDFREDDHADSAGAAGRLELFGTAADDDGVITTRDDADVFAFTTTGGTLDLSVDPVNPGPNLDLRAELRDAGGLVAASNPDTGIGADFSGIMLPAGDYTLHVEGVGRGDPQGDGYTDYGSLGHYEINGTIGGAVAPERFAIDEFPAAGTTVGAATPNNVHDGDPLAFAILSENPGGAFAINPATGALTVANPAQFDHDALSAGWNDPAAFELEVAVTNAARPALDETLRVVVTVNETGATPPVSLAHRYSFDRDLSDSAGGADLSLVGGASVSGGALQLPGGPSRTNHAAAQGGALTGLEDTIQHAVAVSVEGWFTQDAAQNWSKVFMAGLGSGEDYMDITPRRQTDGNAASMSLLVDGGEETQAIAEDSPPLDTGRDYYFAAVWDQATDRLTLHIGPVGGSLETYTGPMGGRSLADLDLDEFHLGAAVYWDDPDFHGRIDEFRVWNGALGDAKVADNFAAGPNPPDDEDLDGLPDTWELTFVGDLDALDGNLSAGGGPGSGSGDYDGDGLSDLAEYHDGVNGTDPTDADSDGDDFPDGLERSEGTDPNDAGDAPGPVLAHRFSFETDASDVVGDGDLETIGGASVTGGSLELPGGSPRSNHAAAAGPALTALAGTINDSYAVSMEAWFEQDAVQNWSKLFMAGRDSGFNYMGITPRRGIDGDVPSASIRTDDVEDHVLGGSPLAPNTDYYCAAIWNPLTDRITLHIGPVGGRLSTYTAPMGGQRPEDVVIDAFRLGAAVQFGDPDLEGRIDEFRVWEGALDRADVAAHFRSGPGQPAGDLDADGLPDEWEFSFAAINDLADLAPTGDFDDDGLSDLAEYQRGTNPDDRDSDGDGFSDGLEVSLGSDPASTTDTPDIPETVLAHRYAFDGNTADAVGDADLTLVGGADVVRGALELPGGDPRTNHATAGGGALAELAATLESPVGVSMEGWFIQDSTSNWSKLFMAGRGSGGEYLDITPRRGAGANLSSISFNDGTSESTAVGDADGGSLAVRRLYYCAAVWDPVADELTLHIGRPRGTLNTYTTSLDGRTLDSIEINEFHLGAAVQFPDPDLQGSIREFRVWRGALSDAEVTTSFTAGPDAPPGDSDGDGLADAWEFTYAARLDELDADGDADGDGLTNKEEFSLGDTDPTDPDTDGDGFDDGVELDAGTDPNDAGDFPQPSVGPPVITSVVMNAAGDTLTISLDALHDGRIYHVEAGTTLGDFSPITGSGFTADGTTGGIDLAISPSTVPHRFFRLVEGPVP